MVWDLKQGDVYLKKAAAAAHVFIVINESRLVKDFRTANVFLKYLIKILDISTLSWIYIPVCIFHKTMHVKLHFKTSQQNNQIPINERLVYLYKLQNSRYV